MAETSSPLARDIDASIASASWIRRMFESAQRLAAQHGPENVFDFSIGNPSLEPPEAVVLELAKQATRKEPGLHKYMPTRGYPDCRDKLAAWVSQHQQVAIPQANVLLTVGSACAINVAMRALVEPGEGVVLFAPWFAEYPFYIMHNRAVLQQAETNAAFQPEADALDQVIDDRTRAVIVNSPNNPTGVVYSQQTLQQIVDVVRRRNQGRKRPIVIISDDVYRRLTYDGAECPPLFPLYEHSIATSSFSKDLGLAGERIGYLALHPSFPQADRVLAGMELCLRTMGFVNAPALMQRVVANTLSSLVDVSIYRRHRDKLLAVLDKAGYEYVKPEGAFFVFPKTPIADDEKFSHLLLERRIIAVPGKGFGRPGHVRLSYATPDGVIDRAAQGFADAAQQARNSG